METVGFIGCGRIGSSMLKKIATKRGDFQLLVHDHNQSKVELVNRYLNRLQDKIKEPNTHDLHAITYVDSIAELVQKSDYIIITIQRKNVFDLLEEMSKYLTEEKVIISTIASLPAKIIRAKTSYLSPVVRTILNIPVVYGKGVLGITYPKEVAGVEIKNRWTYFLEEKHEEFIKTLFKPLGQAHFFPEDQLPIFTAIIACAPAYTFYFMEALLQTSLTLGISHAEAKKAIAASIEGAAYMGSRDGQSFADLRSQATHPGGIAVRAITEMEKKAVQGGIISSILTAHKHNLDLENEFDEKINKTSY